MARPVAPPAPGVTVELIGERDIALMYEMQAAFERHAGLYIGDPATGKIERVASFAPRRAPIVHVLQPRENQSTAARASLPFTHTAGPWLA